MKITQKDSLQKNHKKRIRMCILKIYGGILFTGLLYLIWIRQTNRMIPCFYLATSGFQCPGCGTTRMLLSLLRLDLKSAYFYNPVTFCLFFVWNGIALLCFWGKWSFVRSRGFLWTAFYSSLVVLVCFWVLRNLG